MPSRGYVIPAVILWVASTTWLLSTKVLPTLTSGRPPAYGDILPKTEVSDPEPVRWAIRWNGKDIGAAENKISRSRDGTGNIVSDVQFQQLPVQDLLKDMLGVLGRFMGPVTEDLGPLDLRVVTNLNFDNYGSLDHFDTQVDVGELKRFLRIEGKVDGELMDLVARVQTGDEENSTMKAFERKGIRLPPDALVGDSFSPRPRMANLRVGQTWTFQSYRPLMPHSPLELIEAKVEREELIEWDGAMVRARKVVFRRDAGSGLSSTRKPLSESWVMHDGTVLRQDLWLANIKVQFLRIKSLLGEDLGNQPSKAPVDSPIDAAGIQNSDAIQEDVTASSRS